MKVRLAGLLLLSLCGLAAHQLYLFVNALPRHEPTVLELGLALATFLCGSCGAAAAAEGAALFRPCEPPPRQRVHHPLESDDA